MPKDIIFSDDEDEESSIGEYEKDSFIDSNDEVRDLSETSSSSCQSSSDSEANSDDEESLWSPKQKDRADDAQQQKKVTGTVTPSSNNREKTAWETSQNSSTT